MDPTDDELAKLRARVTALTETVQQLETQLKDVSWKLDRHQKRIESIEDHPPFPIDQLPRYYATETQSVSMAKRKRLGHLG